MRVFVSGIPYCPIFCVHHYILCFYIASLIAYIASSHTGSFIPLLDNVDGPILQGVALKKEESRREHNGHQVVRKESNAFGRESRPDRYFIANSSDELNAYSVKIAIQQHINVHPRGSLRKVA